MPRKKVTSMEKSGEAFIVMFDAYEQYIASKGYLQVYTPSVFVMSKKVKFVVKNYKI